MKHVQLPSRRRLFGSVALLTAYAALPLTLRAALVETIPRVRRSVVAVGTHQRTRSPAFQFRGTGFAVADGRKIVTNAHVLPENMSGERREMLAIAVPDAASGRVAVRQAELLKRSDDHDLAVLQVQGDALPALGLSRSEPKEGQEIAFTGFPMGNVLGFSPVTHRGIISAITPIGVPREHSSQLDPALVRRLTSDPFRVYQLDATAYPGNSGSPLFEPDTGRVIGVINMVFVKSTKENVLTDPSGVSYAIPVRYLEVLL